MTNGPESADAPRRSRRAAGSAADAGPQERESQQRARDREALRAYKALTESRARPEPDSANPPTRRQLRIAQQQAQQAQQQAQQAQRQPSKQSDREKPAVERPAPSSGRRSGAVVPDSSSSPAAASASVQAASRRERRLRAAQQPEPTAGLQPATPPPTRAPAVSGTPDASVSPNAPVSPNATEPSDAAPAEAPAAAEVSASEAHATPAQAPEAPNADVANMSVEQALAAREALKHQARNQVAAMEALQQSDPHAVDLELLAQQRALAERAAVLNRRTQNIQRLAQENEQRRSPQSDPTTAHNLAMVTPLEFVEVPGVGRPVMKPPRTSHVPIVTSSNPAAPNAPATGRMGQVRKPAANSRPDRTKQRAESAEVRHSQILARADALVNAPLEADQGARPIGARSAFGLDPLDVMTAGLGRTRRMRLVSLGAVGVGLAALAVGILMIVGGLGS